VATRLAAVGAVSVLIAVGAFAFGWKAPVVPKDEAADRLKAEAQLMLTRGQLDKAEELFTEAIRLQPDWADLWYERGSLFIDQRRYAEAASDFTRAKELVPSNADLPATLANIAMIRGKWDEAIAENRDALELAPNASVLWYHYSALQLFTGDKEAYKRSRLEMLQRFHNTDVIVAAERTAKTCLLIPEAVSKTQRVKKLAALVAGDAEGRTNPWYILLGGLVDLRLGDAADAVNRLNGVPLDSQPGCFNGTVYSLLALAHHKLDQHVEAASWLEKARECLVEWPDVDRGEEFDLFGDWLRFRILLDEASRTIESADVKERAVGLNNRPLSGVQDRSNPEAASTPDRRPRGRQGASRVASIR
jgi:Flp pilus assembly protein TadD